MGAARGASWKYTGGTDAVLTKVALHHHQPRRSAGEPVRRSVAFVRPRSRRRSAHDELRHPSAPRRARPVHGGRRHGPPPFSGKHTTPWHQEGNALEFTRWRAGLHQRRGVADRGLANHGEPRRVPAADETRAAVPHGDGVRRTAYRCGCDDMDRARGHRSCRSSTYRLEPGRSTALRAAATGRHADTSGNDFHSQRSASGSALPRNLT